MLVFAILKVIAASDFCDGSEHLHDQHTVMRNHRAATFTDDIGMRHLLRVAHISDVINDVVGVLLQRVIGGAVEGGTAAVIIHSQTAADIQKFDRETHL